MIAEINPAYIATIGLLLDIAGVWFIFKFDLGKGIPVFNSDGTEHMIGQGSSSDRRTWKKRLAGSGIWLITVGFTLQIIALWMP
ncbi:hypothetical protein PHACT_12480 [Pseudohongiella acticola]|uniref:Uncharacterized protein n=1 Tax=Pseudohongiella acticola TaxID=1524254 RepID=A0A1E8CGM9_9GAMM|nr:hypothetical protein [Pseudohongiella acticola]OFE11367.1 hypothetical protein PHACT_12480 [Pseudohongiella acticola]